jgi:hypothetical protein
MLYWQAIDYGNSLFRKKQIKRSLRNPVFQEVLASKKRVEIGPGLTEMKLKINFRRLGI